MVAVLAELLGDRLLERRLFFDQVVAGVVIVGGGVCDGGGVVVDGGVVLVDGLLEFVVHVTHPYNHLDRYPKT